MKKNKLFICEKPACAEEFRFLLNDGDLIILGCGIASYKFDYQKISFTKSPYSNETPRYKINSEAMLNTSLMLSAWDSNGKTKVNALKKITKLHKSEIKSEFDIPLITNDFLSNFDEIIFACDTDITGVRGFCFKFEKFFDTDDL